MTKKPKAQKNPKPQSSKRGGGAPMSNGKPKPKPRGGRKK